MIDRDRRYLRDILTCSERIEEYVQAGETAFRQSTLVQDAVLRNFEIIGEAVKQLSEELRTKHSDVPWRPIGRFGDLLIHHYAAVDLDEVWNIVVSDLPTLRSRASEILEELQGESA